MRLSPVTGKKDCQIVDFVDIAGRAPELISAPTLLGLDPSETVDGNDHLVPCSLAVPDLWLGDSLESLQERVQGQENGADIGLTDEEANALPEGPSLGPTTCADYDDPFAFIEGRCGTPPAVHQFSPLAWVSVGEEMYILECFGEGFIRVEPLTDPKGDSPASSRTSSI